MYMYIYIYPASIDSHNSKCACSQTSATPWQSVCHLGEEDIFAKNIFFYIFMACKSLVLCCNQMVFIPRVITYWTFTLDLAAMA